MLKFWYQIERHVIINTVFSISRTTADAEVAWLWCTQCTGRAEIRPQINWVTFSQYHLLTSLQTTHSFMHDTASLTDQIKPVHWREIKHHCNDTESHGCVWIWFKCSFCVTNAFLKLQTFRAVSRSVCTVNHMQNCCIKSGIF